MSADNLREAIETRMAHCPMLSLEEYIRDPAPSRPGVPLPIKLQEQHRALVPLDQPITETCGQRLAAWARGGSIPKSATPALAPSDDRAPLIAEIKSLAVTIPAREKVDAAQTYLSGLSLEQADVAQLADLLAWCRTRTAAA